MVTLYIGVEDNGEITGVQNEHRDVTRLAAFIANRTVPPVSARVELIGTDMPYIRVSVPRKTSIVASSSGKIQRRRLKADGNNPKMLQCILMKLPPDFHPSVYWTILRNQFRTGVYSDLDAVERERLRNIIRTYMGDAALLELSDEELDKSLQFATVQNNQLCLLFAVSL